MVSFLFLLDRENLEHMALIECCTTCCPSSYLGLGGSFNLKKHPIVPETKDVVKFPSFRRRCMVSFTTCSAEPVASLGDQYPMLPLCGLRTWSPSAPVHRNEICIQP